MDMLYLLTKRYYDGLKIPSDIYYQREKKADKRSAKQIIEDTLKGLGGE